MLGLDRVDLGELCAALEDNSPEHKWLRRFKDTLFAFPELREAWFRFHDARMRRRALSWLRDQELYVRCTATG